MVRVSFTFEFCGEELVLTRHNALYWPRERALLVADLHLEKSSFYARGGQLLPPYDSRETLARVAEAIRATGARRVLTLGDNFHDTTGPARLEPHAAGMLAALTRTVDWVWISGNHDAPHGPHEAFQPYDLRADCNAVAGGTPVDQLEIAGIVLRHRARIGETRPELSGHFHPRFQLTVHRRHIRRPCAVISTDGDKCGRIVLPAFGALTGGMDAADPAILGALQPARAIDAIVPAGERLARFTLWRKTA